ncbi:MAG: Sucrose-6-phosphate hydrolase [Tenericutes bacterium ADurb.Bin087]|nr:MAG: Sucrose-6-phosphate hydrolase [Tenericutes bacterium ADurb.Bin087]
MNKIKHFTLLALLSTIVSSCGNTSAVSEKELKLQNGGFETGDLTGWSATGDAFSDVSVQIADSSGKKHRVEGEFYLDSGVLGRFKTGTLKSDTFTLEGNGLIGILLGGVRDKSLCYVSLHETATNEELARVTNNHFNTLVPVRTLYRHTLNASSHIGKEVYLNIVDNDSSDNDGSFILVDDIVLDFKGSNDIGTLIQDARDYTSKYKGEVKNTYRHQYHLMPTIGWMNDPNGLVYHDGLYHLFYQHYPYAGHWDSMHWGHAVSEDLIKWIDAEVALAPDTSTDKLGVFSGGAISGKDGNLHLMYTSVGEGGVQQQGLATSFDGYNFSKRNDNPVIGSGQRAGSRITDFRDPYVYKLGNTYYALIGGKLEGPGGQLILYKSNDLRTWTTVGVTYASTLTGPGMFECPNIINIAGSDIILSSPQAVRHEAKDTYQNIHSVTYQIGEIDYTTGIFTNDYGHDYMQELDKGFDFYATQAISHNNQNIMVAWMNMWSRNYPSAVDGWVGAVTLPRDLSLVDGHLYQAPLKAITNYYTNEVVVSEKTLVNTSESLPFAGKVLTFKANIDVSELGNGRAGFEVFKSPNEATRIYYDASEEMVVFDRRNSGLKLTSADDDGELNVRYAKVSPNSDGIITLELFLDVSSVEVFINDGYYTMSGVVYPSTDSTNITFFSEEGTATLKSLVKHDIEVK